MTIRLAVLGDSIGWGQGASRPADRLAPRLAAALEDHGWSVATRVFAVPGARSRALRAQVDTALGWAPHLAVVVIGANDLTHRVPPARAARHLGDAVRRLREQEAQVVVATAPDLSIVPHVPDGMKALVRAGSLALRRAQETAVLAAGGRVAVPATERPHTADDAFATDRSLFSDDLFHPSSEGYRVIAATLTPAVLEAAAGLDGRVR